MSLSHVDKDYKSRKQKFKKIYAILSEFKSIKKCKILDLGIGSGIITRELAKISNHVVGIDTKDETNVKKNFSFKLVKGTKLYFKDNSFDIIIYNHVLEHVTDQKKHLKEIKRVLKKEGICYLATPNKYWIMERHYKLPLLSFFPRKISNLYLKLVKNRKYDLNLVSFSKLLDLTKDWKIHNITIDILKNPNKYHATDIPFHQLYPFYRLLPKKLLKLMCYFLPSWIFILKKK